MSKDAKIILGIALTLLIVIAAALIGDSDREEGRFRVEREDGYKVYTDKDTGIQYLGTKEGLTVLYDHDGVYVANGWRDYGAD